MNLRSNRGSIVIEAIVVAAVLGVAAKLAGWKPLEFFRPKPPTAQLTELQIKMEQQAKAAEQARKDAAFATAVERAKLEAQIRAAQTDAAGTEAAISKIKTASPESALAARMAKRVSLKLAAAIGALPEADRAAIVELIEQALSEKQEEVDAAMSRLAQADDDFRRVSAEREAAKADAAAKAEAARLAQLAAVAARSAVTAKTDEVKTWADKHDAAERKAGSLTASLNRVLFWAAILAGAYLFLAYVLPGLLKHMDDSPIKRSLRNVSGYALSPLLYHDAKKKLEPTNPAK